MIIDLRELRLTDEPLEVEGDFTNRELKIENGLIHLESAVHSWMIVRLQGDCARVRGHLSAEFSMTCCRCARAIPRALEKDFSVDYWPDPALRKEGEEFSLTYDDLDVGFYRDEQLDLSAVVSEQIVLEIPMKPVCRDECRGLCDQCGADLNEAPCNCDREKVDPRLAALAELKKRIH